MEDQTKELMALIEQKGIAKVLGDLRSRVVVALIAQQTDVPFVGAVPPQWTGAPVAVSSATPCPIGVNNVNLTASGVALVRGRRALITAAYTKTGAPGPAWGTGTLQYSMDSGATWFDLMARQGYDGAIKTGLSVRADVSNVYELQHPIPAGATNVRLQVGGGDGTNYLTITLYARAFEPYAALA